MTRAGKTCEHRASPMQCADKACRMAGECQRPSSVVSAARRTTGELEALADQLDVLNRLNNDGLPTAERIASRLREIAALIREHFAQSDSGKDSQP